MSNEEKSTQVLSNQGLADHELSWEISGIDMWGLEPTFVDVYLKMELMKLLLIQDTKQKRVVGWRRLRR